MNNQNEVLTFAEACEYLRISAPTMRKAIKSGEVPFTRVSGSDRFLRSALEEKMRGK